MAIPWHALESNEVIKRIGAHIDGVLATYLIQAILAQNIDQPTSL
jgi:hypothetical protein